MCEKSLILATLVVLLLLACAACAACAPSAFWAATGAAGLGLGLLAVAGGKLNTMGAGIHPSALYMETVGGSQKMPCLFASWVLNKGALQRSRVFLEKRAKRVSGVGGFGARAVKIMASGGSDARILETLRGAWLAACGAPLGSAIGPNAGRASARLAEAAKYFNHEKIIVGTEGDTYRYLDVGSSEGSITAAVADELGLKREQATAVDVVPQAVDSPRFEFIQIDGDTLPFADATFDLITMFMSAHHFADAPRMFAEAARVAKPGGRLVLREHGTPDAAASLFYDFVHAFYEVIAGEESTPEEFAAKYALGNYATYRKVKDWSHLMLAAGFAETRQDTIKDTFDTVLVRYVRG